MNYIGIDPGQSSGAIAVIGEIDDDFTPIFLKLEKATEADVFDFLSNIPDRTHSAVIEKLSNMASPQRAPGQPQRPGRGSKANWSLSGSYHGLRMALVCCGIPFVAETASKWQLAMGCRTAGDKKISQRKAQELYPSLKVSGWKADALLLATYCRRHHKDLF